ncbi:MAG: caspase family protein [Cytophagales bacterium]|nr:caspase family protein [Cytophagales bacterium]
MNAKIIGIAIDQYADVRINNLQNCVSDTTSLMSKLHTKFEFDEVELLVGREETTRKNVYYRLREILINAVPEDDFLIVFMGHGELDRVTNKGYWLLSDSMQDDITSWIDNDSLLALLKNSEARHIVLISDSCFSGSVFNHSRGGGLMIIESKKSRFALTSGGIEKVKDGQHGGNSPFTFNLLKSLDNIEDQETSFKTFCEKFLSDFPSNVHQTPQYGTLSNAGDEGGTFILRRKDQIREPYFDLVFDMSFEFPYKYSIDFRLPNFHDSDVFESDFINSIISGKGNEMKGSIRKYMWEFSEDIKSRVESLLTSANEYSLSKYHISDKLKEKIEAYPDEKVSFKEVLENLVQVPTETIEEVKNDPEFTEEDFIYVSVGYEIKRFDENYLSIGIFEEINLNLAPHPNSQVDSLNFAFKPDRLLDFDDIFDFSCSLKEFLDRLIQEFALEDEEQADILLRYTEYVTMNNLAFTFSKDNIFIDLSNVLPRVAQACGVFSVPVSLSKLL